MNSDRPIAFLLFLLTAALCIGIVTYFQRKAFIDPPKPAWVEVGCTECEGDGQVEGQRCGYCDDNGMMQWKDGKVIKCLLCNGTTARIGVCPMCGGKGKMYLERR